MRLPKPGLPHPLDREVELLEVSPRRAPKTHHELDDMGPSRRPERPQVEDDGRIALCGGRGQSHGSRGARNFTTDFSGLHELMKPQNGRKRWWFSLR